MKPIILDSPKVKGKIFAQRVHWSEDVLVLSLNEKEQKEKPVVINGTPYKRISMEIRRERITSRYSSVERRHVPVPEKEVVYRYNIERASLLQRDYVYGTIVQARLIRDAALFEIIAMYKDKELLLQCNLEHLEWKLPLLEKRLEETAGKVALQKQGIKQVRQALKSKNLTSVLLAKKETQYL